MTWSISLNGLASKEVIIGVGAGVCAILGVKRYLDGKHDEIVRELRENGVLLREILQELRGKERKGGRRRVGRRRSDASYEDYFTSEEREDSEFEEFFDIISMTSDGEKAGAMEVFEKYDEMVNTIDVEGIEAAYEYLTSQEGVIPRSAAFLWRLSQASVKKSQAIRSRYGKENRLDERQQLFAEAKGYGAEAMEKSPDNLDAIKWYAVSMGCLSRYLDTQSRMRDGVEIRRLLDAGLKINGDDSLLLHMKGRWCYEVAQLTWYERTAIRAVAGDMTSTLDEAKHYFDKVEQLAPRSSKSNLLMLGKCIQAQGGDGVNDAVREVLEIAQQTPRVPADEDCDEEIERILNSL